MSDLQELYQNLIIDHSRSPKNFGVLENATIKNRGVNPICGDELTLYLLEEDGIIKDVKFTGVGCAISTASASLMTETIKGKTREEAEKVFDAVHQLITGKLVEKPEVLGKLMALKGVSAYPMRVKCASLSWHALKSALHYQQEPVSTEHE